MVDGQQNDCFLFTNKKKKLVKSDLRVEAKSTNVDANVRACTP